MCQFLDQGGILSENEINRIIYEFNNTEADYPQSKTVQQLFEEQAARNPKSIAAAYKGSYLTYEELNIKANQVAHWLRKEGVKRDAIVGLMVSRSLEMMVGILGILKAGGAYLPLDPQYPESRIKYMLEDSGADILLTQQQIFSENLFTGRVVFLDDEHLYEGSCSNPININSSNDIAYVIYTSGSTGKPKGVLLEHKGIINFIKGISDIIDFSSEKTIVSLTTISFDIFVLESFLPLSVGMKVVIADPRAAFEYLAFDRIDMLQTTPSTMVLILNEPNNLKYLKDIKEIMLGGEAFPTKLLTELQQLFPTAKIYNMYGPTETTVWSTVKDLTKAKSINIGKPIANTQIYILDEALKIAPIGTSGELYISGDGLARGYLNRPEMTEERFIDNPFIKGRKMYKTGDIAMWNCNGEIEYIGRADHQVKIRGFRIELKEIEECLREYPKVKECVVATKLNKYEDKYMVAYYVANANLVISELISHLKESLPEYMIPGFFVRLDKFPLTPNGKIDRNLLQEPDNVRPDLGTEYKSAENEIEADIVEKWKKVLNLELIGVNDNFFELGGNSVLLSMMYTEIDRCYPGRINVADIFAYPTVAKLAAYLCHDTASAKKQAEIRALRLTPEYTLGSNTKANGVSLKVRVKYDVLEALITSQSEEGAIEDIFIGLYAYLLHEISGQSMVTVYTVLDKSKIAEISLEMESISDLSELFNIVKRHKKTTVNYSVSDLNKSVLSGLPDSIIPIFVADINSFDNVNVSQGLKLGFYKEANDIELLLNSEAGCIIDEKAKEFLYNYINLLKAYVKMI